MTYSKGFNSDECTQQSGSLEDLVTEAIMEVLGEYGGCELTLDLLLVIEEDVSQAVSQVMANCAYTGVM